MLLLFIPTATTPLTLWPLFWSDRHTCDLGISVVLDRAGLQQLAVVDGIKVRSAQGGQDRTHHWPQK